MRGLFTLLLFLPIGFSNAENTIIAIVNEDIITFESIQQELDDANSFNEKIAIIDQQIDITLQIKKISELGIKPSQEEIKGAIAQVALSNKISLEQLQEYPQFPLFLQQIIKQLSLLKLEHFITQDLDIELNEDDIIENCTTNNSKKGVKQIKIAQIIISQVEESNSTSKNQKQNIKNFLEKLSDHITKGASFEAFAKLHSQHPSYVDGGLSDWIFVNNPTIEMLDFLKKGEVSKIYITNAGFAIAIKIDERYVNSDLENCKKKIIYLKAKSFYSDWLNDLRDSAYIKIYTDKL